MEVFEVFRAQNFSKRSLRERRRYAPHEGPGPLRDTLGKLCRSVCDAVEHIAHVRAAHDAKPPESKLRIPHPARDVELTTRSLFPPTRNAPLSWLGWCCCRRAEGGVLGPTAMGGFGHEGLIFQLQAKFNVGTLPTARTGAFGPMCPN